MLWFLGLPLLFLVFKVLAGTGSDVRRCCQKLSKLYHDQVFWTNASQYVQYNERWTDNSQLNPTCIFLPTCADEVSKAIKIFKHANDDIKACQFAVKSGGHMPHAGANDIDGGAVIDLSWINETTISIDRSYLRLGSGNTWSRVYDHLNGTNLAVPGGRCSGTGVGGIALGGGYSWLTPKVGWVADNVVNYELVTANGDVLNANKTSHSQLFTALKGGGNTFGIVTRFDVAAFEHDQQIQGGFILMPVNATDRLLRGFDFFMQQGGQDEAATLALEFVLQRNSSQSSALAWVTASDGSDDHPSLQPITSLQSEALSSTYGPTTFADYPGSVPPVSRVLFATTTIKSKSLSVLKEVHEITTDIYKSLTHIPDLTWDIQYDPLPKAYRDRGAGGNVLGLNYTDDDLIIVFLMPLWKDAGYDDEVSSAMKTWLDRVQEYTNVNDVGYPFEYLNYAASFQDPLASYGASNLKFLRDVAKKYDLEGFFQSALPGGFKLGEEVEGRGSQHH